MKTNNSRGLYLALIFLGTSIACSKESESLKRDDMPSGHSDESTYSQRAPQGIEIIANFTWGGGGLFPNCAGGGANVCGECDGLCVIIRWVKRKSGQTPNYEAGEGILKLSLSGQNLFVEPDRPFDNGDGYVRIDEDVILDQAIAADLGFAKITVLRGTYKVIGKSATQPHGKAKLNFVGE